MNARHLDIAAADPSDPQRLDRLLAEVAPEASYLQGKFLLKNVKNPEAIAGAALFTSERFDEILSQLSERHRFADRRALVSYWTLYYFSALSIAPIVFWLRAGLALPLRLEQVSVVLSGETGLPQHFLLEHPAEFREEANIGDGLGDLLGHLTQAVVFLSENYGVSSRLLWSNSAVYIDWALREFAQGEQQARVLDLLETHELANGSPNPLRGLVLRVPHPDTGEEISRRKVCCLRYLVPDVPGCGMVCPIPNGRA